MHVISCRVQDELLIGESIRVTVLEVAEDRVRLGIASPHETPSYREKVVYLTDDCDGDARLGVSAEDELLVEA